MKTSKMEAHIRRSDFHAVYIDCEWLIEIGNETRNIQNLSVSGSVSPVPCCFLCDAFVYVIATDVHSPKSRHYLVQSQLVSTLETFFFFFMRIFKFIRPRCDQTLNFCIRYGFLIKSENCSLKDASVTHAEQPLLFRDSSFSNLSVRLSQQFHFSIQLKLSPQGISLFLDSVLNTST